MSEINWKELALRRGEELKNSQATLSRYEEGSGALQDVVNESLRLHERLGEAQRERDRYEEALRVLADEAEGITERHIFPKLKEKVAKARALLQDGGEAEVSNPESPSLQQSEKPDD